MGDGAGARAPLSSEESLSVGRTKNFVVALSGFLLSWSFSPLSPWQELMLLLEEKIQKMEQKNLGEMVFAAEVGLEDANVGDTWSCFLKENMVIRTAPPVS